MRTLAIGLITLCLVACTSTTVTPSAASPSIGPLSQPSATSGLPTPSTATTVPASPITGVATLSAALVGWRQGDLVVAIAQAPPTNGVSLAPPRTGLVSFDPASRTWQHVAFILGGAADGQFVTDGRSVAWIGDTGGVGLVRSDGTLAAAPALGGVSADEWIQYRLVPLLQGGYLLADATSLVRLSSDGQRWQAQPLPAGYVALAGTSDGAWFALARQNERDREGGTILGSSVALFNAQTHTLIPVVGDGATNPSPAVGGLLHYLFDHVWYRVAADGRPQRLASASTVVSDQTLSPDGSFTAGGCPLPRTLRLTLPLAVDHVGLTAILAAATVAPSASTICAAFFGPIIGTRAAPELAGGDLDGWAWTSDHRVAAIVDVGDIGGASAQQVLVIETPNTAPLQIALSGVSP